MVCECSEKCGNRFELTLAAKRLANSVLLSVESRLRAQAMYLLRYCLSLGVNGRRVPDCQNRAGPISAGGDGSWDGTLGVITEVEAAGIDELAIKDSIKVSWLRAISEDKFIGPDARRLRCLGLDELPA